jgi:FkbM family methyltransferase
MMLPTRRKMQIARTISAVLRTARAPLKLGDWVTARRGGIAWRLDLREGIDLAIYLNAYQRIGRHVRANMLRPGMTVLDIGANIGAFTLPLAAAIAPNGQIIAVEATQFAFAKLQANIALNPGLASRILPIQAVLAASDEPASGADCGIYSSWRLDGGASEERHPAHGGRRMSTAGAIDTTLDSLLESEPLKAVAQSIGFVKLDVDGNELDVLRGGRRFLQSRHPDLLIEIAPYVQDERPGGLESLLTELRRLNYHMEQADTGAAIEYSADAIRRLIPPGAGIDVLFRPA